MSADGRPLGGGDLRPAPAEGRGKENRSAAIVADPADSLQPVAADLVAEGTKDRARELVGKAGWVVLRVVAGELRVRCPYGARELVKATPGAQWDGRREWVGMSPQWADRLTEVLTGKGFEVRREGIGTSVRIASVEALPECSNEMCRSPFRLGAALPLTCSACGERVTAFHYYDPST